MGPIALIKKICWDCITGIDGESVDPARISLVGAMATYLGTTVYDVVWLSHAFQYQQFGIGLAAIMAAGGWGISVKSHTEPQAK